MREMMSRPIQGGGDFREEGPMPGPSKGDKTKDVVVHALTSKKEAETFQNRFKKTLDSFKTLGSETTPLIRQIQIMKGLIDTKSITLKINGQPVTDLLKSPFQNFSEDDKEAVLQATFFSDFYDKTILLENLPIEKLIEELNKPVLVQWNVPPVSNHLRRIAIALKASPHSPANPSSIEIKGTG
ncbi:MAG: hypothetical protein FJZ61_00840 [Chlamydiae bacterium]|nr:hypothetical protein [Chlamydiota bacterium]